ncbi:MAG: hypothetical protein HC854_07305 [Flavobacterium sp.]|nr:hypothetical protein [Flavobacterium sp.]
MKKLATVVFLILLNVTFAQEKNKKEQKTQIVEASCGQCQFGMKSKKGCDLAVRIDGKSYFVEGSSIDEHGDAHGHDGFCEAIRQAEVVGEVKENVFVVSSFKLLPKKKK